jgi:flagellar basal-body rod protein FlgB
MHRIAGLCFSGMCRLTYDPGDEPMADSILFDRSVDVMHQALNISSERNRLITSNIANVDTIGYKPTDLDFKEALLQAMESSGESTLARTHTKHFETGVADQSNRDAYRQSSTAAVDIDQEMTNLAENNIQYRTSSEMLMRKLNLIKYSIAEGGK